ncbi:hypothetical protein [Halomicrococcus sp. NG-SE-24]|uniref:hypothetical protein n=1 Tax=Halomicrococcus sp. NG-SE-24 TaxID=3436928 RepID=UPI003D997D6C
MSDEGSQDDAAELSEARDNSEFSEQVTDSGSIEQEGERTDTEGVPEGGYVMAPTSNDPDRGSGDSGSNSDE